MVFMKKKTNYKILVNQGMRHVLTTTLICNLYLQFRPCGMKYHMNHAHACMLFTASTYQHAQIKKNKKNLEQQIIINKTLIVIQIIIINELDCGFRCAIVDFRSIPTMCVLPG